MGRGKHVHCNGGEEENNNSRSPIVSSRVRPLWTSSFSAQAFATDEDEEEQPENEPGHSNRIPVYAGKNHRLRKKKETQIIEETNQTSTLITVC